MPFFMDRIKELRETIRDEGAGRAGFRSSKSRSRMGQDERNFLEVLRENRVKLINTRLDALKDVRGARGEGILSGFRERWMPEKKEEGAGSRGERSPAPGRREQARLPRRRGEEIRILS